MENKERDADSIFVIDIAVQNNTLIVGMNGGNVIGVPGDQVIWRTAPNAPPFTLEFFQIASEPTVEEGPRKRIDVAQLARWPFSEPSEPPPNGIVGPTWEFAGILAGKTEPPTTFTYYVTAANLRVDPIVIIDG